ncbi:MAG: hypothetical protein GY845_06680 [Planctomycetes bacterium]|nr:hypothetical protein [Planctomycetota bacterium]
MIDKNKLEGFRQTIITDEHRAIERDAEIKARKDQLGLTKEDVRQLARLRYKATVEDKPKRKPISSGQTVVKRIRQLRTGLGSVFLAKRPADEFSASLKAPDAPSKPKEAQRKKFR